MSFDKGKMYLAYRGRKGTTKNPVIVKQAPKKKSFLTRVSKSGIKPRLFVRLGYSESFSMNTGAVGAYAEILFNLNGLYDPDQTFAGHQPYARDTYALMYNKYRVWKLKYHIQAVTNAGGQPNVMGVLPNNNLNTLGSMSLLMESPYSKYAVASNAQKGVLRGTVDIAKLEGRSKSDYGGDINYEAIMTTNPSEQIGLHFGIAQPFGVASSISGVIHLEYLVEFFDPIQQAQS